MTMKRRRRQNNQHCDTSLDVENKDCFAWFETRTLNECSFCAVALEIPWIGRLFVSHLWGPYIKDVRKNPEIFDTPLPLVRISRNLSVLFVRKIDQFLNPPSPLSADVICTWSLTKFFLISRRDSYSAYHWTRQICQQGT